MRPSAPSPAPARADASRPERVAEATGHFGEILQGRLGPEGPVALVTLPCRHFRARAALRPSRRPGFRVSGSGAGAIAERAARLTLEALDRTPPDADLVIETNAPPGGGAGSSTLSALTAMRALAGDGAWRPAGEAGLCLAAEGAVDPLMWPDPGALLWASRRAFALALLPPPPRFAIVGGFDGPGCATDPGDHDFPDIADLAAALRAEPPTARLWAESAAESAARNQARNPKPRWAALTALAESAGALGPVVAHTGSAAGLLFAEDAPPEHLRQTAETLAQQGLDQIFVSLSGPAPSAGSGERGL